MIRRFQREIAIAGTYAILLVLLLWLRPAYFQGNQFLSTLIAAAPVLVMSIGMTLVILARHIDISLGSQFSWCGIVVGLLAQAGLPMPLVALCAVLLGGLL